MNSELADAQAVYLRAPAEGSQRATFTADGDLAIDPDLLADGPDIGRVLVEAGYERGPNPGAFRVAGAAALIVAKTKQTHKSPPR